MRIPSLQFDSKKVTPEEIQSLKDYGQTDDFLAQLKQRQKQEADALLNYQRQIEAAQGTFAQAPQFVTPEQQNVSQNQALTLGIGDILREVVSTAPRKFRQERTPSIAVLQGLKDQDYAKKLQQADIAFKNDEQRILANQRAAELGLRSGELGLSTAQRGTDVARDDFRDARNFGFQERQFEFSKEQWDTDVKYRDKVHAEQVRQFNENLGWDKEKFNTPEFKKAQMEFDAMVDAGIDPEVAERRAYGRYIIQDQQIKLGSMSVSEKEQMMKLLPAQIADQLAEYAYNKQVRPLNLSLLKKQVANYGRGGQGADPLTPFRARLNQLQGLIDTANANKAANAAKSMGKDSVAGDAGAFDRLINYYIGEQQQIARDMNYAAGATVVDPGMFRFVPVGGERSLRETVGG